MTEQEQETRGERMEADLLRKGITGEMRNKIYEEWSSNYDQDVHQLGYTGYRRPTEKLCQLYPANIRDHVRILDVGAGTGLLGLGLKNSGFVHIDGLDASKHMMEEARKRDVYQNYFIEFLTENPLDIKQDTYDVVVGSGIFTNAHVPYTAIYEMIRLTKPGGHVVLSMGEYAMSHPEFSDIEPTMDKLEKERKWKLLEKCVIPGYLHGVNGILYVFQIQ